MLAPPSISSPDLLPLSRGSTPPCTLHLCLWVQCGEAAPCACPAPQGAGPHSGPSSQALSLADVSRHGFIVSLVFVHTLLRAEGRHGARTRPQWNGGPARLPAIWKHLPYRPPLGEWPSPHLQDRAPGPFQSRGSLPLHSNPCSLPQPHTHRSRVVAARPTSYTLSKPLPSFSPHTEVLRPQSQGFCG